MAVATEQASFAKTGNVPENGAKDVNKTPTVEEYVGTLLSRIQPAAASEYRRRTVAQYVQDVIAQAFQPAVEVKAFTYGSVPLKTYLPDGDIDLAIFQNKGTSHHLKETWFTQLSAFLQRESFNQYAPYRVRDVQVIHAEVKLVKCLVDNIVVDISFQSLGGLCTVNFLESIDRRIDDHHLFKRSIILVKAWCYYESRLLGAHHGLISTYALETMVLYIFMVYHKSVTTPLKVLHKFLTVFSKFDWDHHCLSLRGPIPVATFPDPKPLPFPDMKSPPLLKEDFMEDMRHMYSPPGFNTEAASTLPKAFQLKYLNIMDPLLPTNNLGRSVNKSSFARIRRALEYGANRLSRILKMGPTQDLEAVKSFFQNTWNAQRSHTPSTNRKLQPQHVLPASDSQRAIPAVHMGQSPSKGHAGHGPHSISLPTAWHTMQGLGSSQAVLYPQQMQQMMLHQQNQALYHQLLHPSMSLDTGRRYMARPTAGASEKPGDSVRPWSAQGSQEKQGQAGGQNQKGPSPATAKASSHQTESIAQTSKRLPPGKPLAVPEPHEPASTQAPSKQTNSQYTERASAANGGSHREALQQPVYTSIVPPSPMYNNMLPGMPQRIHPIVNSLQLGSGYADYFKSPYPLIMQNGSLYNPSRMPPAYVQAHPSSAPVNVNSPAGKADQRYSEVEANAGKSLDKDDVILSGNLEQLSQQLQSATAMFNSQSAPSTSRSQAHGGLGENGHGPGGMSEWSRPPTRSSSMGSLHPNLRQSAPVGNSRRPRQDTTGASYDTTIAHIPHHPSGTTNQQRQRLGASMSGRQQMESTGISRGQGFEHLQEGRPGMLSDRGSSQPSSPGFRPFHAQPQMAVPNPFNTMTPAEWPLLNGKARPPTEYSESLRWGSQSDGHSGWASPAGSVVSEQSLASVKAMRANGSSPPPPPSNLLRGTSPKAANGIAEGPTRDASNGQESSKVWREDFVLAEEDFPGLPGSTPQGQARGYSRLALEARGQTGRHGQCSSGP